MLIVSAYWCTLSRRLHARFAGKYRSLVIAVTAATYSICRGRHLGATVGDGWPVPLPERRVPSQDLLRAASPRGARLRPSNRTLPRARTMAP